MRVRLRGLVLSLVWGAAALADPALEKGVGKDVKPLQDAPPLVTSTEVPVEGEALGLADTKILEMFLRMDIAFSGGKAMEQGFSLPSVRLGARGDVTSFADYQFALGATREFSSALLPQMTPVEAWVRLHDGMTARNSRFSWRVGMYTPTVNPWWSPDLTDLPLPDYAQSHAAVFPNRDLGTEIRYRPFPGVGVTAGMFNGAGITGLNTNSARGFNGMVDGRLVFLDWDFHVGVGGFLLQQSDSGSVNYINNAAVTVFLSATGASGGWQLAADVTSGRLEDSVRNSPVVAAAVMLFADLWSGVRWYTRGEALRFTVEPHRDLNRVQAGPVLRAGEWLQAFLLYEYLDQPTGTQSSAEVRIRLNL